MGIKDDQVGRRGLVLSLKDRIKRSRCSKSDTPRMLGAKDGKAIASKPLYSDLMLFWTHWVPFFSVLCLLGRLLGLN